MACDLGAGVTISIELNSSYEAGNDGRIFAWYVPVHDYSMYLRILYGRNRSSAASDVVVEH